MIMRALAMGTPVRESSEYVTLRNYMATDAGQPTCLTVTDDLQGFDIIDCAGAADEAMWKMEVDTENSSQTIVFLKNKAMGDDLCLTWNFDHIEWNKCIGSVAQLWTLRDFSLVCEEFADFNVKKLENRQAYEIRQDACISTATFDSTNHKLAACSENPSVGWAYERYEESRATPLVGFDWEVPEDDRDIMGFHYNMTHPDGMLTEPGLYYGMEIKFDSGEIGRIGWQPMGEDSTKVIFEVTGEHVDWIEGHCGKHWPSLTGIICTIDIPNTPDSTKFIEFEVERDEEDPRIFRGYLKESVDGVPTSRLIGAWIPHKDFKNDKMKPIGHGFIEKIEGNPVEPICSSVGKTRVVFHQPVAWYKRHDEPVIAAFEQPYRSAPCSEKCLHFDAKVAGHVMIEIEGRSGCCFSKSQF